MALLALKVISIQIVNIFNFETSSWHVLNFDFWRKSEVRIVYKEHAFNTSLEKSWVIVNPYRKRFLWNAERSEHELDYVYE